MHNLLYTMMIEAVIATTFDCDPCSNVIYRRTPENDSSSLPTVLHEISQGFLSSKCAQIELTSPKSLLFGVESLRHRPNFVPTEMETCFIFQFGKRPKKYFGGIQLVSQTAIM